MTPELNQFFLVYRHVCGKIFYEDPFSHFCAKLLTDGETDGQTNKRRALHNLLGGDNEAYLSSGAVRSELLPLAVFSHSCHTL